MMHRTSSEITYAAVAAAGARSSRRTNSVRSSGYYLRRPIASKGSKGTEEEALSAFPSLPRRASGVRARATGRAAGGKARAVSPPPQQHKQEQDQETGELSLNESATASVASPASPQQRRSPRTKRRLSPVPAAGSKSSKRAAAATGQPRFAKRRRVTAAAAATAEGSNEGRRLSPRHQKLDRVVKAAEAAASAASAAAVASASAASAAAAAANKMRRSYAHRLARVGAGAGGTDSNNSNNSSDGRLSVAVLGDRARSAPVSPNGSSNSSRSSSMANVRRVCSAASGTESPVSRGGNTPPHSPSSPDLCAPGENGLGCVSLQRQTSPCAVMLGAERVGGEPDHEMADVLAMADALAPVVVAGDNEEEGEGVSDETENEPGETTVTTTTNELRRTATETTEPLVLGGDEAGGSSSSSSSSSNSPTTEASKHYSSHELRRAVAEAVEAFQQRQQRRQHEQEREQGERRRSSPPPGRGGNMSLTERVVRAVLTAERRTAHSSPPASPASRQRLSVSLQHLCLYDTYLRNTNRGIDERCGLRPELPPSLTMASCPMDNGEVLAPHRVAGRIGNLMCHLEEDPGFVSRELRAELREHLCEIRPALWMALEMVAVNSLEAVEREEVRTQRTVYDQMCHLLVMGADDTAGELVAGMCGFNAAARDCTRLWQMFKQHPSIVFTLASHTQRVTKCLEEWDVEVTFGDEHGRVYPWDGKFSLSELESLMLLPLEQDMRGKVQISGGVMRFSMRPEPQAASSVLLEHRRHLQWSSLLMLMSRVMVRLGRSRQHGSKLRHVWIACGFFPLAWVPLHRKETLRSMAEDYKCDTKLVVGDERGRPVAMTYCPPGQVPFGGQLNGLVSEIIRCRPRENVPPGGCASTNISARVRQAMASVPDERDTFSMLSNCRLLGPHQPPLLTQMYTQSRTHYGCHSELHEQQQQHVTTLPQHSPDSLTEVQGRLLSGTGPCRCTGAVSPNWCAILGQHERQDDMCRSTLDRCWRITCGPVPGVDRLFMTLDQLTDEAEQVPVVRTAPNSFFHPLHGVAQSMTDRVTDRVLAQFMGRHTMYYRTPQLSQWGLEASERAVLLSESLERFAVASDIRATLHRQGMWVWMLWQMQHGQLADMRDVAEVLASDEERARLPCGHQQTLIDESPMVEAEMVESQLLRWRQQEEQQEQRHEQEQQEHQKDLQLQHSQSQSLSGGDKEEKEQENGNEEEEDSDDDDVQMDEHHRVPALPLEVRGVDDLLRAAEAGQLDEQRDERTKRAIQRLKSRAAACQVVYDALAHGQDETESDEMWVEEARVDPMWKRIKEQVRALFFSLMRQEMHESMCTLEVMRNRVEHTLRACAMHAARMGLARSYEVLTGVVRTDLGDELVCPDGVALHLGGCDTVYAKFCVNVENAPELCWAFSVAGQDSSVVSGQGLDLYAPDELLRTLLVGPDNESKLEELFHTVAWWLCCSTLSAVRGALQDTMFGRQKMEGGEEEEEEHNPPGWLYVPSRHSFVVSSENSTCDRSAISLSGLSAVMDSCADVQHATERMSRLLGRYGHFALRVCERDAVRQQEQHQQH